MGPLGIHDLLRRGADRAYARLAALELPYVGHGATISPRAIFGGTRNVRVGADTNIWAAARLSTSREGQITLGDNVWVGPGVNLNSSMLLEVGNGVMLAANGHISTNMHAFEGHGTARGKGAGRRASVRIDQNAWIGTNAVIMPGVTIGANAVVGANSVVTSDVDARTIVAGAPAKVLRAF